METLGPILIALGPTVFAPDTTFLALNLATVFRDSAVLLYHLLSMGVVCSCLSLPEIPDFTQLLE